MEMDQPGPAPQGPAAPPPLEARIAGAVTPLMLDHLRGTKPWVRFVSVCSFICSGVVVLIAFAAAIVGALSEEVGAVGGAVMGVIYVLVAVIYVVFAVLLHRYANAIRDLLSTSNLAYMETALGHQRVFWRSVGITTIVALCIYAMLAVIGIIVGFLSALTS